LFIGYATKSSEGFSRRALLLWFVLTPPVLLGVLSIVHLWMRAVVASSRNACRAVIVGVNTMSVQLARAVAGRPDLGLQVECVFDVEHALRAPGRRKDLDLEVPIRYGKSGIADYVNRHRTDVVFVALPIEDRETQAILAELRDTTSSVYLIPDIAVFDLIQARSDEIEGIPVIALCESPFQGIRGFSKRATDIVFASLLLLFALPVMGAIAVAIKVSSPGSVLFRQHRYGLEGERISVYKFRTMTVAENGGRIVQAKRGDPRVTPVGAFLRRTSLDELPQLINVLQGRMSLVGPRPHAVAHNEQYRKLISGYMVRHKVAPGITGLAQVNGCRGETATLEDMRRRVAYDLEYLRHWRWSLDLKIMFKTCVLLFRDDHAY
jgi:putative colanic acid biosynthesis UDP-glucose lipid carrier transferase